MRRFALAIVLASLALSSWSLATARVGKIDYVEGGVSISSAGRTNAAPNIDDALLSGDLVKTGKDGLVVIALDKSTGMNGTLTVSSRSALYLKLELIQGEPRTSIDLLAGSVGSKVSKVLGSPSFTVTGATGQAGVRGTRFVVALSLSGATLVACSEGLVAFRDDSSELSVPAGKAAERRPGARLAFVPVAISSAEDYASRWIAQEIEAFAADAPRALADYEKRYTDYFARFAAAYEPFQRSPVLRKWLDEDQRAVRINPRDPGVMNENREMAAYLLDLRKVLFLFERIYYRVDELSAIVAGTDLERVELKPGLSAGAFLDRVARERDLLARQVARYAYATALFRSRNPDSIIFSGDETFFSSSDGF